MNFRTLGIGILTLLLTSCATMASSTSSVLMAPERLDIRTTSVSSPESTIQLLHIITIVTDPTFNPIISLEFGSNAQSEELILAGGGNGAEQTYLWSVPEGQLLNVFPGVFVGLVSAGTELITELPTTRSVQVFSVTTAERVGILTAVGIKLNPARYEFVSWSGRVVDIASGQELRTLEIEGFIKAFSPDGKKLAVMTTLSDVPGSEYISLLNIETGNVLQSFVPQQEVSGTSENFDEVIFDVSGSYIASIAYRQPAVRIWDVASGLEKTVLTENGSLTRIAFSPDGRFLVVGHADGTLSIWDWIQEQRYEFPEEGVAIYSLAFSPDGRYLAAGNENGLVEIWKITK